LHAANARPFHRLFFGKDIAMTLLQDVEAPQLRKDLPPFHVGDTIRVYSRIREGEKERVQYFEGIVIGFHRNGIATTFKVRKESYGVGVERTYPIHSPLLERIEVKKKGDVRRAKLFFLRGVSGKRARIREKKGWLSKKAPRVPAEGIVEPAGDAQPPAETPKE
jgi:large subunit ribosomal protein L19